MEAADSVVAIVDDDDAVRRALRRLILSLSYRSVGFASGEEFLANLHHTMPSCALVDLHMPGLKGLDVLLRMRTEGPGVPVIIITGFDQAGMREKCLEAGASDYLVKPIERSKMASAIEAAIAGLTSTTLADF
jgi:FixJ family two-component response regulator